MGEFKKHTLLIVDDEPEVLAGLRGMFRRHYDVVTTERASEALQLLKQREVHVVVSDQRMPDMSGTDFLARVSEEFPNIVRLMITGYADIDSVIDAINRGHVYRYISKPWDPAELETAVKQAFDQYDLIAERRRLLRELEEANQLKTAFITIASHELNTPLTIVTGMLQLAIAKSQDRLITSYLERSLRAARRLQSLLSNTIKLLQQRDFHRSLERGRVVCSELFAEIKEDLEPYLRERKQSLILRVEPNDLEFRASRIHLRDVLENLVTNSIKFSPDGSVIHLAARQTDGSVFEVVDKGWVHFPISPRLPNPFRHWTHPPFFRGLWLLRPWHGTFRLGDRQEFVEMHGGVIPAFKSSPNKVRLSAYLSPSARLRPLASKSVPQSKRLASIVGYSEFFPFR
ncbi:MAG: hybrid sensor histidine kinase/response regulator [Planctomycetota bacterium]